MEIYSKTYPYGDVISRNSWLTSTVAQARNVHRLISVGSYVVAVEVPTLIEGGVSSPLNEFVEFMHYFTLFSYFFNFSYKY